MSKNTPAIKIALTKSLKEQSSVYFKTLADYLLGRISKQQFDTLAIKLLEKNGRIM
jgi:hypothetical protein